MYPFPKFKVACGYFSNQYLAGKSVRASPRVACKTRNVEWNGTWNGCKMS